MVPTGKATVALILLSSAATIVASQALISGAFSLTRQAQQLGYFPRVTVKHTAAHTEGQIYIPEVNWLLACGCLLLVIGFQKSERLASAYGIAVTGTMMLTSFVFYVVMRHTWKWPGLAAAAVLALFLSFDVPFFLSNSVKLFDGGWVPVMIGIGFITAMLIWSRGRTLTLEQYTKRFGALTESIKRIEATAAVRVPGTAIFMSSDVDHAPPVLVHLVERTRALHEKVYLLTVLTETIPTVPKGRRIEVTALDGSFTRIIARYGYMEITDVPVIVREVLGVEEERAVTYFLGREAVLGSDAGKMGRLAEGIFGFLQRNAVAADRAFKIPPAQAIEIGIQVDL
jgi:KUP system potassium uptake protein